MAILLAILLATPIGLSGAQPFETRLVGSPEVWTGTSNLTNFDLLGIAFNPFDDPAGPIRIYVAHGEHCIASRLNHHAIHEGNQLRPPLPAAANRLRP